MGILDTPSLRGSRLTGIGSRRNRDFNVILIVKRPSAAMSDPDEARYNAVMADLRKELAEDKQKSLVEGYNEMRTVFGQEEFRQLTFK